METKVKAKKANLKKANKAVIIKKITAQKDLDYIYPAEAVDLDSRKSFRRKLRKRVNRLLKALKNPEKSKIKDLDKFKAKTIKCLTEKGRAKYHIA